MAARLELTEDGLLEPPFYVERQRLVAVVVKRAEHRLGVEPGRFDCLLRVHAELDHVQENLQERLVLAVAPGGGKDQPRFAVLERQRGGQRDARTLVRRQLIGVAGRQHEALGALAEGNAGVARDHCRDPGAAGSRRKHVAGLVDDVHAGGVLVLAVPLAKTRARKLHRGARLHALGVARDVFRRGRLRINQRPADARILFGNKL